MPQVSENLFNLSAQTPEGSVAHGQALIHGGAEASAMTRRGIDLSAGIELEGRLGGELGEIVVASLEGKAEAGVGVALSAAFPVDLFDEAGLIARFRAQAAASASVAATLDLELEVFKALVRERFDPPLEELLEIFLDEVRIGAGIWGRAALSAEIYAQAVLAGSLLEDADREPGFTFSAEYGIGWGAGAGAEFAANFGFDDPRRMLGRLADATSAAVLEEADRYLRTRPATEAAGAAPAMAILRVLLPLATSTAVQLGFELATASDEDARERGEHAVVEAFIARAQQLLLEGVVEFSVERLGQLLSQEDLPDAREQLSDARLDELQELLLKLRDDVFVSLGSATTADPDSWLLAILDVLEEGEGLLSFGFLPQAVEEDAQRAVAMLWAGGMLAHRVVEAVREPSGVSLFGAAPAPVPGGSPTAAYVAAEIGKPAGSGLSLADLVSFLLVADPLEGVREAVPWASDVLDWLEEATGATADQLMQRLLVDFADPDDDAAEALLQFLGGSLAATVGQQVVPKVLNPIKARDPQNEALRLFVDDLVVPLLVALPIVVLPNLPQVDTEDGRIRLREALSAILLQSLGQFLLKATDILLHHGLEQSEQALRETGQSVRAAGEQDPVFAAVASVAAGAVLPLTPTPGDVDRVLQISADVVALIDQNEREHLIEAAEAALAMGLGTEQTRTAALAALTGSDDPPRQQDLEALLSRAEDGAWSLMGQVGPQLLALILGHFVEQVALIAKAIEAGAKEIVAAAEAALELLGKELEALKEDLKRLVKRAGELLAGILADVRALTAHLKTLVTDVIGRIRSYTLSLIDPLIADFPQWAKDLLRGLLNALFDAITWLFTLPATLLGSVAGWVESIITSSLASASHDEQAVRDGVRQQVLNTQSADVKFCLSLEAFGQKIFDIGCVTLPGSTVLGAVADTVASDPIFTETVRQASDDAVELRAVETQKGMVQGKIDETLDEAGANAAAADLTPGQPLSIRFDSPEALEVVRGAAELSLIVEGANRTFVESVLGVPRRLRLKFNDREYVFAPEQWEELADGALRLDAHVAVPAPAALTATAAGPEPQLAAASVRRTTGMYARLAEDETIVFAADASIAANGSSVDGEESAVTAVPVSDVMPSSAIPSARIGARRAGGTWIADEPAEVKFAGAAHLAPGDDTQLATLSSETLGLPSTEPVAEVAPTATDGRPVLPGREGMNAVQVAVSDGKGLKASDSLVFFLAEEAPPRPRVTVERIEFAPPGPDWENEFVLIRCSGSEDVELTGWRLRDLARHIYVFPSFTLRKGSEVRVWTGPGADDEENLHWGRRGAVWNNDGDAAVLTDRDGREIHRYTYVPTRRPLQTR